MFHNFEKLNYETLGPWKNYWGYTTTIGVFDQGDIVVKTLTPYKTKIVRHFDNWEECEQFIELIEEDRRY